MVQTGTIACRINCGATLGHGRTTVVDCRVDPAEQVFPMIPAGAAALDMLEYPGADTTVEARAL